jgi:hypothetical protein
LDVLKNKNPETGMFECDLCKSSLKSSTDVRPEKGSNRELLGRFNQLIAPISRVAVKLEALLDEERIRNESNKDQKNNQ